MGNRKSEKYSYFCTKNFIVLIQTNECRIILKKAVLQLAKGLEEKSIESLNKVLETGGDDQISLIKAHLIFAEYYIIQLASY